MCLLATGAEQVAAVGFFLPASLATWWCHLICCHASTTNMSGMFFSLTLIIEVLESFWVYCVKFLSGGLKRQMVKQLNIWWQAGTFMLIYKTCTCTSLASNVLEIIWFVLLSGISFTAEVVKDISRICSDSLTACVENIQTNGDLSRRRSLSIPRKQRPGDDA